jgi:hypothetical protein
LTAGERAHEIFEIGDWFGPRVGLDVVKKRKNSPDVELRSMMQQHDGKSCTVEEFHNLYFSPKTLSGEQSGRDIQQTWETRETQTKF